MEDKYLLVKDKLKKYNQEHLLKFYNKLGEDKKEELLDSILKINFEQIENLYNKTKIKNKAINKEIEPINYTEKEKLTKEEMEYYNKIGEEIIKNKQYAVVTMAGGQRY